MSAKTFALDDRIPTARLASSLLAAVLVTACGGSGSGGGQSGVPGEEGLKPGGGTFYVDPNRSGSGSSLHLAEVLWGRLVDVYEVDAGMVRVDTPVFTDFVIEPGIVTNGAQYVLDRDPVTQRERLTIQAQKTGVLDSSAFDDLLVAAADSLPVVSVKGITSSSPFSTVPRNACVVLRFDDCLDNDAAATLTLTNNVKVTTGYPPTTPFEARVVFDPNHGAVVRGTYYPTRVLVDLTVSQGESTTIPLGINAVGLPARSSSDSANVAVRVPSQVDIGSGQSSVLTNVSGQPLDLNQNGPVDGTTPTLDIVRALRSGNSDDDNNGFLSDTIRPRVVSAWAASITNAIDDATGTPGRDFVADLSFTSTCLNAPAVGDVVFVNGLVLQVTAAAALAGSDVTGLNLRSTVDVPDALGLLGAGQYQTTFLPSIALPSACWVTFLPEAETFPATGVSTSAQVLLRFNEPMDPASLSPFGGFLVVKGASGGPVTTNNIVVGEVLPDDNLTAFSFDPSAPYPHVAAAADPLHVRLGSAMDLAGNPLAHALPFVDFTLSTLAAPESNGAIVLRFESTDEYGPNGGGPDGFADLRGQFFYDTTRGSLIPRGVNLTSWPVQGPVPNNMVPGTGFSAPLPLNPLGTKLQALWRYCDFGWNVRDETKYNLDVFGLSWAPATAQIVADFFDRFEIQLGHSRFLPDEDLDPMTGLPRYPASGLPGAQATFASNYLAGSNPTVVHNRALGYTVSPSNIFTATNGTRMIPYPLNRGNGPTTTYTWRDTSILAVGADGDAGQPGVPTGIEGTLGVGGALLAGPGAVPSIGLPLLVEYRCFPSDSGLGLNTLSFGLSSPIVQPVFRNYSAGGINTQGNPVQVLPDAELSPSGIFNPFSTPPGLRVAGIDNGMFFGQLDTVVRVSRIHTAWLDSNVVGGTTIWGIPVMDPPLAGQPLGTGVVLEFRSATGFTGGGSPGAFNAAGMNAYGNQTANGPTNLDPVWAASPSVGNGRRYVQLRMTFVNNISTGISPELKALALPFDIQ